MKKILYISTLASKKRYEYIQKQHELGLQVNKFDRLLVKGFSKHTEVFAYSALNFSNVVNTKDDYYEETIEQLHYIYPNLQASGIKKLIILFKKTYRYTMDFIKDEKSEVVINLMCMTASFAAILACKRNKKKCIGILTDLPQDLLTNNGIKQKIKAAIHSFIINRCDYHVFLAEAMREKVKTKAYIVVEGSVNSDMQLCENRLENKFENITCHYAGMIFEKYGVEMMVKAFIKANVENAALHIYGNGSYANELKEICKTHDNIKYFGVKNNDYVIERQVKSHLLINPRTNEGKFTKYSFPSKNLEYMVSGTPALICKLDAITTVYEEYVYLLQDQTVDGMAKKLKEILSLDPSVLYEKGKQAKEFVLEHKSNVKQTKRILDFIQNI